MEHYSQVLQPAYGDCKCACHTIPGIRHSSDSEGCCSPDDPKPTKEEKDEDNG